MKIKHAIKRFYPFLIGFAIGWTLGHYFIKFIIEAIK